MKEMLAVFVYILLRMHSGYYQAVVPREDIPAGTVIVEYDLTHRDDWSSLYYQADRQQIVGHVALKTLPAGSKIRLSDIKR